MTRIALALALTLAASSAYADAIDGNWCQDKGRRLTIAGPTITTPGGARITGDYSRHAFTYTVPQGEPGAGSTVQMYLMGEEHVQVKEGDAAPVVWNRCGPSVS